MSLFYLKMFSKHLWKALRTSNKTYTENIFKYAVIESFEGPDHSSKNFCKNSYDE